MELEKLKVTELKAALVERGLETKGNKAVLVQRLKEAMEQDEKEEEEAVAEATTKAKSGGDEIYNPEEETPSSPEPETNGNNDNGENDDKEDKVDNDKNGDDNDGTGFEGQKFVQSKPSGISFGLHEPTKVKPQPKELQPPAVEVVQESPQETSRQGAAAFFAGTGDGQEAAVPLPPSTSFMEESDDDEEEGPPGLGNPIQMQANQVC